MKSQRISVVICAYTEKRWSQILAAVDSVCAQSVPPEEIIVVVDHNRALFTGLTAALPHIQVVENFGAPGLSGAKNTSLALFRGDVVAFLDDDAVADSDWLRFFTETLADPRAIGVGGLVLPLWETEHPRWFPAEFDWVVGCNYLRMPRSRAMVRNLMGGNMSLRREAFDLVGGFRNGIGRSTDKRPFGCEDTEFCIRLSQRSPKSKLLFDCRAVIRHVVPASRCRFSYFLSRCFGEGLSKAAVAASVGTADGLSDERYYTTRILPRAIAQDIIELLDGDLWGLARAGAIVVGLATTAAGYAAGSLRRRSGPMTIGALRPGSGQAKGGDDTSSRHDRSVRPGGPGPQGHEDGDAFRQQYGREPSWPWAPPPTRTGIGAVGTGSLSSANSHRMLGTD